MFKDNDKVHKILEEFKRFIIEESKKNLKTPNSKGYIKDTTGKLSNSIKGETKVMPNSIRLTFDMLPYGWFQDKGVSGKNVKFDTPFSYKDKMPPPSALDKWVVRKGIHPRDSKGKFTGRSIDTVGFQKSITFLIARKIFFNGIKPSLFFTKPFKKYFSTLGKEVTKKYGIELMKLYEDIINESIQPNVKTSSKEYIKIEKL